MISAASCAGSEKLWTPATRSVTDAATERQLALGQIAWFSEMLRDREVVR